MESERENKRDNKLCGLGTNIQILGKANMIGIYTANVHTSALKYVSDFDIRTKRH